MRRRSYTGGWERDTVRTNLERLLATVESLQPLLPDLVFVGGAVTGLLVTDAGAGAPRTTLDVDAVVGIGSYPEYAAFGERLRALGYSEDMSEGAPVCRWVRSELLLDVMPLDESILGFSNRWYRVAMASAVLHELPGGRVIRLVPAPCFLATKIEAFQSRGTGDHTMSHDLEDMIYVVDGRGSIVDEVDEATTDLRQYLRHEIGALLGDWRFLDALPGYLRPDAASQARIGVVIRRLRAIAAG